MGTVAKRERGQRRRLAFGSGACCGSLSRGDYPSILPRGCGLCSTGPLRFSGSGKLPVRHPASRQQSAPAEDRTFFDSPMGTAPEKTRRISPRFFVSREELGSPQTGGCESRMAQRRVVPSGGIHRHESATPRKKSRPILKRSRYRRAVDQRGKERAEMDETVLPRFRGQPSPSPVVRVGL